MSFANNSNRDKNSKILEKFVIALNNAAKDCLESKSNDMKARNYAWFKEYLLESNVWISTYDNDEKKENQFEQSSHPKSNVLYDSVLKTVDLELIKQKQVSCLHNVILFTVVLCLQLCNM